MGAFYKAHVLDFLRADAAKLMLDLTTGTSGKGFDLMADQHAAWLDQIQILRNAFKEVQQTIPKVSDWGLLLEYQIPGRPKRLDAVVLDGCGIIAIEFKVGATEFKSGDKWQLREYCWNLRDFHVESEGAPIAPILVATAASEKLTPLQEGFEDKRGLVLPMQSANAEGLAQRILYSHQRLAELGKVPLDLEKWDASQSHATRTTVEEAQRLFQAHDVREVKYAHADNTTEAQVALINIVRQSREEGNRSICFVTGVPGAGKTLVGLEVAYSEAMTEAAGETAYFASGNRPLLDVLQAAITLNRAPVGPETREAAHDLSAKIKNVHDFALENLVDKSKRPPPVHVVIFDEAQRVWDAKKVKSGIEKRLRRGQLTRQQADEILALSHSEPDILIRVMERCPGWCVIIALVGGGQEIWDGEVGLDAWGKAVANAKEKWTIWASTETIEGGTSSSQQKLFSNGSPPSIVIHGTASLYLSVVKRSPRAEKYAEWVDRVLAGQPEYASKVVPDPEQFPILVTRQLSAAKGLLEEYAGGSRFGLVASSGAARLRSIGIEVNREFRNSLNYTDWFLRNPGDIRSSNQLEVAATEFECQGLELDWTCLCWAGDLIPSESQSGWSVRYLYNGSRKGPHWRPEKNLDRQKFVRNRYRVLLTRARFGLVLFVPPGDANDSTQEPSELDSVVDYLRRCGLPTQALA